MQGIFHTSCPDFVNHQSSLQLEKTSLIGNIVTNTYPFPNWFMFSLLLFQWHGVGLWILWEAVDPGDVQAVLGWQWVHNGWNTVVVMVIVGAGGGILSMVAGLVVMHLNWQMVCWLTFFLLLLGWRCPPVHGCTAWRWWISICQVSWWLLHQCLGWRVPWHCLSTRSGILWCSYGTHTWLLVMVRWQCGQLWQCLHLLHNWRGCVDLDGTHIGVDPWELCHGEERRLWQ